MFSRPGVPLFPAEWILTQPALVVGVRSTVARTGLGLGYLSGGASWQASYEIVLGRTGARVAGQATITLGPLRVDSAEVQLLAGDVGRARPGREREGIVAARMAQEVAGAAAGEQAIGEVHLYTVPGRLSLEPGVATTAMLFEPVTAAHERTYTLRGQIPFWGGLPQYGEEQRLPLQVTHIFRRPLKTAFGDLPLPGGTARVYERDSQGRVQLVGEGSFPHLPAGQDLRLDAGTAFDLTARRIQTEYSTRRDSSRTTALATYKVTLTNAKDSVATVDVLEERGGEWAVLTSSVPPERVSSTVTRFRVRVPAQGQAILTYRVRLMW